MYLLTYESVESANHKKTVSANSRVSHMRQVCKSNKLFKSPNLQICNLRNLFADRSPLLYS
jgi:hypothetical protein